MSTTTVVWKSSVVRRQGDLGLRPMLQRTGRRFEGHLFISVLTYHCVHLAHAAQCARRQRQLEHPGQVATKRCVTVKKQRRYGRTAHLRKATCPKPQHQTLTTLLKLEPNPGRTGRVLN